MVDFAMDVYKNLYSDDIPHALREKRTTVVAQLKQLQAETEPIVKMFEDPETTRQMQSTRDGRMLFDYLADKHGFRQEYLDTLYRYAKFQYECGNYSGAAEYLYFFRVLVPATDRNALSSLWGKLASEILMQNWDAAMEDLTRLKETIDNNSVSSPLQSLQQRTWLIHWSLFVFFNHPKGRDNIIDLFLYQPQYLNAIQTMCPHILRYLTTAVITNKDVRKRRQVLKDLVKVIQQESYTYKDPITEFVECLYVNFDFDGAQKKLRECESVLVNDFFLVACLGDFIENARLFIFETFCRIHQCISISMLADKLNMTPEEAERWIVNLIRNARLDAKIDSKLGHVVMGNNAVSPYQQVIEKTKSLSFRSQMLAMNIEKKLHQNSRSELRLKPLGYATGLLLRLQAALRKESLSEYNVSPFCSLLQLRALLGQHCQPGVLFPGSCLSGLVPCRQTQVLPVGSSVTSRQLHPFRARRCFPRFLWFLVGLSGPPDET
ncbi:Eukaryotic translation initiation factor 3 subunit E [Heterocephalus glaber]|uniref:Eukaryotic translation initiation factor 3 subunit E n=1 Tax=Heterocephalus glaber TaxID=10181 RepID=G5BSL6_HETGA|nr:Eukaryotic translation initiation factor 3 subunit E [Heterocephalus glaber]